MKVVLAFWLMMSSLLVANDSVAQKIDTAIEFARAGRQDLALQQFQRLLQMPLMPVEKASVLYNSAVVFASTDRFWDAMVALNQIDRDMFDKVVVASPVKALQIAYNGGLSSVGFAKRQLQKPFAPGVYTQKELDAAFVALESARYYIMLLDELVAKNVIPNVSLSSFTSRTQLQEDIANLSSKQSSFQQLFTLEQLDKSSLLNDLGGRLQQQFFALLHLYMAGNIDELHLGLYMQAYAEQDLGFILFALDRLMLYLQAPAKAPVAGMHAFFEAELLKQKNALQEAFKQQNPANALSALDMLLASVLLIEAQTLETECTVLLELRIQLAMQCMLAQNEPKLGAFWQSQWQQIGQFFERFLAKKAALSAEPAASLLALLQKRLRLASLAVAEAADDALYWKILSQPENTTYMDLVGMLHAADSVERDSIRKVVQALIDRIEVLGFTDAKPLLIKMLATDSPLLLFQDAVTSWMYVDPKAAFSFMLGRLVDECASLHMMPESDSFTARTDYHLVMHMLELYLKNNNNKVVAGAYESLMQRVHWFTDKEKKELDFFAISLQLSWLKEIITGQTDSLQGITQAVDFGVEFQKKTMALLRYMLEPNFQSLVDTLTEMQQLLIQNVAKALQKRKDKGPKIKQVISLVADAQKEVKSQNRQLASMQAVLNSLEQASKILHSMQSESQEESQSSGSSQEPESHQELKQMQAIKLAPELSIRLLQEMQQQDKGLQTQSLPQTTGARPW